MPNLLKEVLFIGSEKTKAIIYNHKLLIAKDGMNGIEQNGSVFYTSSDGDPYFYVNYNPSSGWYMLEFCLSIHNSRIPKHLGKLYLDTGAGFDEVNVIKIPFINNQTTVKRIIFLPEELKKLRFDPLEDAYEFEIISFSLKPLLSFFAISRMLNRLSKYHHKARQEVENFYFEGKDRGSNVIRKLIYEDYDKSFIVNDNNKEKIYQNWIEQIEVKKWSNLDRDTILQHNYQPLFSIIIPVYNVDLVYLKQALASIEQQTYSNWELCIADDASTNAELKPWLLDYGRNNPKVKLCFREENGHISAASNSALALAAGDYVVLLDQDDELASNALLLVAQAIQQNPSLKIIYSDEDKIDERGKRFEPHFKPDWSPDLFYSNNYISHLGVYERDLVLDVGGFRVGVEGAQDYDLCLRCVATLPEPERQITHLPYVLYHWRTIDGSTAKQSSAKSYTWDAGLKALNDMLPTSIPSAIAEKAELPNTYRIKYNHGKPLVSLIIPTKDNIGILKVCLESIFHKTNYNNYEIIVVDNNSQQSTSKNYLDQLRYEHNISVLEYPHEFNYSAINNYAAKHAKGTILGLLNNDIEVIASDWLDEMVMHACRSEIGCVGAKLLYPDNRIQHAGIHLGVGGIAGHTHKLFSKDHPGYFGRLKLVQNFSAVTAACLLVRAEVFHQVKGLDEDNLSVAFNDVDFCLRIKDLGYRNLWTPYALLYHHESLSRGSDDTPKKAGRFSQEVRYMLSRWGDTLYHDPYYHNDLSLKLNDLSIDMGENVAFFEGFKKYYDMH